MLVPPEDAAACNVLQLTVLGAAPPPPNWLAASSAAGGALTACLQLHLPMSSRSGAASDSASRQQAATPVRCTGAVLSGDALVWPARPCRVHLPGAVNAALKAHLELGRPLLLEAARYLSSPAAEALADPAFGAYHALLHLECAEQLQEPGAVSTAGHATAVGCMSWALQQGKAAASALPAYTPPAG